MEIIALLYLISLSAPFFILFDYYKKSNIHKSYIFILSFFAFFFVLRVLLPFILIISVLIPLLIFFPLFLKKK
jgi:hypothetical protein